MENPIQQTLSPLMFALVNQLADLQQKIGKLSEADSLRRNLERIHDTLGEMGVSFEIPLRESFSETRTDVEAHIAGTSTEDLEIIEVIKPIVRFHAAGISRIIQKGVVVAQSRKEITRG